MSSIKKQYQTDRIIVVADKGLNSGDNIAFNSVLGDGYVYSQSVKGASEEFKSYVLNDKGYTWMGKDYKRKSRVVPTLINVTVGKYKNGKNKKKKIQIDQKQVIFYSQKYADRAKKQRTTSHGAATYVVNIEFNKNTGKILDTEKPCFKMKKR